MNKPLKITLISIISLSIIVAIGYSIFIESIKQIDFVGYKDPKSVEANNLRWNNMLLSAEFRKGTDYCEVNLLDSANIEINLGDKFGGTFLNEKYEISNDTIIVLGGIAEHAKKYLQSDRFPIHNGKLFFKADKSGLFDTTTYMRIKFNKLKSQ